MLKWLIGTAIAFAATLFVAFSLTHELSSRVPVLQGPEYQECLQRQQETKSKALDCGATETLLNRTRRDPISYWTLWTMGFTGVLALAALIEGMLIFDQIALGREEFEAAHRPWIAILKPCLPPASVHIDETQLTLRIDYSLQNTSNVPALDVVCVSSLAPATIGEEKLREIVKENLLQYERGTDAERHLNQNQVIFPNETISYRVDLKMVWNVPAAQTCRTREDMSNLLAVSAFFYGDGSKRRRQMHSACVHEIRLVFNNDELGAAKSGTGVMMDGEIGKWNVGWSAA